jgi:hypothetical protein
MPPPGYRAPVVRADQYEVEYENGVRLPRNHPDTPWVDEAASIFEGQQAAPPEPMGGTSAGPMLADAGTGAAFNQAIPQPTNEYPLGSTEQQLLDSSRTDAVVPTWGAPAARALGGVPQAPSAPRYADLMRSQGTPPPAAGFADTLAGALGTSGADNQAAAGGDRPGTAPPFAGAQPQGAPTGYPQGGGGGSQRVSTTTQTQGGVPIDEEALRGYNYQSGLAAGAERDLARVRGDAAQARMESAADVGARANAAEAERVAHERERLKAADTAESDYRRAVTEFSAREVDPAKWYHDRGTGGTIAAALAMGLGAFGASLTGGPNTAVQIISDAINADIDAQKSNIATAGKGLEAQRGLLGEMRARFGDERQAEAAAKAAIFDQAARDAVAMEAQAEANGAPLLGQRASALLGMAAAEYQQKLRGEAADRVTTARTMASSSGGGGGGGRRGGEGVDPRAVERYALQRQAADQAQTSLDAMRRTLAANPTNVEGVGGIGGIGGAVPRLFTSAQGKANRAHLRNMAGYLVQAMTGAAATPEQQATQEDFLGINGDDEEVRRGVERAAVQLAAAHANLQGGYGPDVVSTYLQQGGNAPAQATPQRRGSASD